MKIPASKLLPGDVGLGYTVVGSPTINDNGECVVPVQYTDGGLGERVFPSDDHPVPLKEGL
jgi:hypothetical protein